MGRYCGRLKSVCVVVVWNMETFLLSVLVEYHEKRRAGTSSLYMIGTAWWRPPDV